MKRTYCHLPYRVPFSETDAMAIVHHSNHAKYFERGRVEYLRLVDLEYTKIMEMGLHFPLTSLHVDFRRPLRFDDLILVETSILNLTKVRLNFEYRIFKLEKWTDPKITTTPMDLVPLVLGETHHCAINAEGRPTEMGNVLYERLSALYKGES